MSCIKLYQLNGGVIIFYLPYDFSVTRRKLFFLPLDKILTFIDIQEPIDPGAPCRGFLKGITF